MLVHGVAKSIGDKVKILAHHDGVGSPCFQADKRHEGFKVLLDISARRSIVWDPVTAVEPKHMVNATLQFQRRNFSVKTHVNLNTPERIELLIDGLDQVDYVSETSNKY